MNSNMCKTIQQYKVAGHVFAIEATPEQLAQLSNYTPFIADENDATNVFTMRLSDQPLPAADGWEHVHTDSTEDNLPRIEIYRRADEWLVRMAYTSHGEIVCAMHGTDEWQEVTLYLLPEALQFAVDNMTMLTYAFRTLSLKTLLFHASVTMRGGKGYMFLGHSGTGKSTHSQQWLHAFTDAELLNDDNPVVRLLSDETVHLSNWPKADEALIDTSLERQMYLAQQATSMILSLRKRAEKNVRQPLQKAVIPTPDKETTDALLHVADLIKSEVNVKELVIVPAEQSEIRLVKKIKPQFKVLGKKVGGQMKALAAAIAEMSQDDIVKMEADGQFTLLDYTLVPEDVEIVTEDMPGWLVANNGILTIALDIELTDELIEEGIARELINRIQNLRKSSGLEITDRINIRIEDRPEIHNAVLHCNEYIASQVLAISLNLANNMQVDSVEMDGYNVIINIQKV